MFSPGHPYFSLSDEGKKEYGHIFPDGEVPIKKGHLVEEASLEGSPDEIDRVCCVDWGVLTAEQKMALVAKVAADFQDLYPQDLKPEVRAYFEELGYVPMRIEFVLEAYDLRFFV